MTNIEEFRAETLPNRPDSFSAVLASSPATVPLHSIENLRWTKIAVSWGATSPDQPFHFIRFLTEA
ncbi:MAG: hypothetical protein ACXW32_10600, partial [Limisphaerales bacterium]